MKNLLGKMKKLVNASNLFALAMVIYTVNATCIWAHHQPEVPDAAKKFRKF